MVNRPLIVSVSGLALFLRCRKSYQFQYVYGREPKNTNQYVEKGASFHKIMEYAAKNGGILPYPQDIPGAFVGDMYLVAEGYVNYKPLPKTILSSEKPVFVPIFDDVYLRYTPDLLYMKTEKTLIIRDYKTFSREPSIDVDMDMQARLYIAMLMAKHKEFNVEFEYEYVRSTPVHSPRGTKAKNNWQPSECFKTVTVNLSDIEFNIVWNEVREILLEIDTMHKINKNNWYRNGIKGTGPHTCSSCFVKELCARELENGFLIQEDFEEFTKERELMVLP